jgi:Ser-tRNA(Ala) deacylase AlaX
MNETKRLFLENTYLFSTLTNVLETGRDEHGIYFIVDQSIYHPQGGGQPNDQGHISIDGEPELKIVSAKYADNGIRHYTERELSKETLHNKIYMHINSSSRKLNAAYHTSGHWLSQVVLENLQLPLFPIKGHHFPGEAYIEFEGDFNCITTDTIDEIKMAMQIDLHVNPKMIAVTSATGSEFFESALLPKNFKPPVNKPLRFTQIEGYRWIPCGGTHVESLLEIKSVQPVEFYMKGGKIRLKYSCEM